MALWDAVEREIDLQAMSLASTTGLQPIGTAVYETSTETVVDLDLDDDICDEYGY